MSLYNRKEKPGFTIVELLIVVVVIAILALITVTAFNGVQQRARNAQTLSQVQAYKKAIELYAVDSGAYPTSSGCLGANYPSNQCWQGPNGSYAVNATVDNLLVPYMSSKPTVSTKALRITNSPDYRQGAVYITGSPSRIIYYLEGASQRCLSGSIGTTEMQGTQCTVSFDN